MAKQEKFGKICKEHMTKETLSLFERYPNFFITNYMGTSVSELELLRKNLDKISSKYMVVKNSIIKVVLEKLKKSDLVPMIDNGVGIAFSGEDILTTCKALVTFTKDHDKFKIKSGFLEGRSVPADRVKEIAALPSREGLIARVVGGIKSPLSGFVNVLEGTLRKFVYVVEAIKNKKG